MFKLKIKLKFDHPRDMGSFGVYTQTLLSVAQWLMLNVHVYICNSYLCIALNSKESVQGKWHLGVIVYLHLQY